MSLTIIYRWHLGYSECDITSVLDVYRQHFQAQRVLHSCSWSQNWLNITTASSTDIISELHEGV